MKRTINIRAILPHILFYREEKMVSLKTSSFFLTLMFCSASHVIAAPDGEVVAERGPSKYFMGVSPHQGFNSVR